MTDNKTVVLFACSKECVQNTIISIFILHSTHFSLTFVIISIMLTILRTPSDGYKQNIPIYINEFVYFVVTVCPHFLGI